MLVGHTVKTTFLTVKICIKTQLFMMILRIMMMKMILLIIMILKSMTAQIYRRAKKIVLISSYRHKKHDTSKFT